MVDVESKVLSCVLYDDILCVHRKTEKFGLMDRCLECSHYERFLAEMLEQDMKEFEEIDRIIEEFECRSESLDG